MKYVFIIILILLIQEPSLSNSSQDDVQTRKKRGLGHLDKSSIISSDKRSKRTRNDKKYPK